ncbi:MAG TPA: hypothetical protein VHZ95_12820 [Polyangiales bacterium]|nr:hypothetical protein [Polyangiales bacterium]
MSAEGMNIMLTTTQWIVLIAAVAIVLIAAFALISSRSSRRRHGDLRRRFGPEYEREVQQQGSVAAAERELMAREKRVHKQRLRTLPENERVRFAADWEQIQTRFVDEPSAAVQEANELIKAVMLARGYEVDRFDQRVADLSVEHANVVQHYRAARVLADANREGRANTEELRQALVHYRALFSDLLAQTQTEPQLQEVHV